MHASYHIDDDKMIILLDFIAFAVRVEMRKRMRIGLMQKPNIKHFLWLEKLEKKINFNVVGDGKVHERT